MNQEIDFSLPQAPQRRERRVLPWLTFLTAAGCLALLALLYASRGERAGGAAPSSETSPNSPEVLRQLGESLERRTLYAQAADVWGEYADVAGLGTKEAADVIYRRAKNLQQAGRYADAARLLTQLEHLELPRDDRRRAVRLLSDCLSALGKEEVRENVLKAYTIPGMKEEGTVVARVGGDAITLEELRKELRQELLGLLKMQGSPLDPDEREQRADEMVRAQMKSPEVVQRLLQQVLQGEVLYREALSRNYGSGDEYSEALKRFRRRYLAGRFLEDHIQEALKGIGPTDLQNHYEAHKERFVEKPSVDFSYREFPDEHAAKSALKGLVASDFLRGEGPAVQGEPIPGIGRSAEATAHLLALDEGQAGDRAIRVGDSWYVFRTDAKREKRQKSFEEAEAEVRADLARAKQAEAAEKLQEVLAGKYRIEILQEELKKAAGAPEEPGGPPAPEDAPGAPEDAPADAAKDSPEK